MSEKRIASIFENSGESATEVTRQIARLCGETFSLSFRPASGEGFQSESRRREASGVESFACARSPEGYIALTVELIKAPPAARVPAAAFFQGLSGLGLKTRLLPPKTGAEGVASLYAGVNIEAKPLSPVRRATLAEELRRLAGLADGLRAQIPEMEGDSDWRKRFSAFEGILAPVPAVTGDIDDAFRKWGEKTAALMEGGMSVALSSPYPGVLDYAAAALSAAGGKRYARLIAAGLAASKFPELVKKAPGLLVAPACRLSFSANPYELSGEMRSLLFALADAGTPVIFTGTFEGLQTLFSGGQGSTPDPLYPISRRVPDVPLESLVRYAVESSGSQSGGLPRAAQKRLTEKTAAELSGFSKPDRLRLFPVIARRNVARWEAGKPEVTESGGGFAASISQLSETFSGLSPRPRARRRPAVQAKFGKRLTDPRLSAYLKRRLTAQDRALSDLCERLCTEALTRPSHQPIRYCAQGTPATGKSESAGLLARWLNIPYVNIDAAGMPDYHTAAAQLLGSGRGIVMSHRPGRLEEVAKHHAGVVVEVSDLDHAPPNVRSALADLFLQVLETGEAQSATGAMFSCANVIFAFTMNLPGGADESVRKEIGFAGEKRRADIEKTVSTEIKQMLSGAFVSRVGTPILFDPLRGNALVEITRRAVREAVSAAASRTGTRFERIEVGAKVGVAIQSKHRGMVSALGARVLLERSRAAAARAYLRFLKASGAGVYPAVRVDTDAAGDLTIVFDPEGKENAAYSNESPEERETKREDMKPAATHDPAADSDPDIPEAGSEPNG